MGSKFIDRTGEIGFNNNKNRMTIIEYKTSKNLNVKFDNGYITKCTYQMFQNGEVRSPYDKTKLGIGYVGVGKYKVRINNKLSCQYIKWDSMFQRCYNTKYRNHFAYRNCTVCDEWLNFQNFAKWYDENYYMVSNEDMQLDKDILHKGNKIYSPNNCVFVPQRINILFVKSDHARGEYPIGVTYCNKSNDFVSRCCNSKGGRTYLGNYNNINQAFNVYKNYKERLIKQVADEYKNQIPQILYDALYKYKVEITD